MMKKGLKRAIGIAVLATLARPVALGSGALAAIHLFFWIGMDDSKFMKVALISGTVFVVVTWFLWKVRRKSINLLEEINRKEGMHFGRDMLGEPGPIFIGFDCHNRKLAICNAFSGEYEFRDFSYILGWEYTWNNYTDHVPSMSAMMGGPVMNQVQKRNGFMLVVNVASPAAPMIQFMMPNEHRAQLWCAKLNAMMNG